MSVHRIRLLGPWDYTWDDTWNGAGATSADSNPVPTVGTIKMPCDWKSIFGLRTGRATFSRRFHKPTNLESHERVFIVLTGVGGAGTITLNQQQLFQFDDGAGSAEVEVTAHLESFNQLQVTIGYAAEEGKSGGLHDAVVLEIRQA